VIYNALPPAGHAAWTMAALAAGKAVLCEKPFARDAVEARAMVEASHASGQPLIEAFHYRFHTVMRRAEALVREGALGALHTGAAEFHAPIPKTAGELRWSADQGGGGMMDLGCYPLHAMRTLTGAEPLIASAHGVFEDGVDSAMRAELVFPGGTSVSIACSMTPAAPSAWLRLEGERGRLDIVNFIAPQIGCRFTTTLDGETTDQPTDGPTTYAAQLAHLHDVLTGEAAPLTGGADAVGNMTAIDAIYAKARP
jgi:predicted dehydrogenase